MIRYLPVTLSVVVGLCSVPPLVAQDASRLQDVREEPQDSAAPARQEVAAEQRSELIVVHLNNLPGTIAAEALRTVFPAGDLQTAVEAVSNSLLIRGSVDAVQKALAVLEELDRPQELIDLELMLLRPTAGDNGEPGLQQLESGPADQVLDAVRKLQDEGTVEVVEQVRLATLNNQPAFISSSQQEPVTTGNAPNRGFPQRTQSSTEKVGMTLGFTPRVAEGNSTVIEVDFERTELVDPAKSADANPATEQRPPTTASISFQATLKLNTGQAIVVAGQDSDNSHAAGPWILIVTAWRSGD